jgi:16S rRNA (guanine1207-N2)-methyltransferase/23S rRNA (guanine1835-N2)-methyltransferase
MATLITSKVNLELECYPKVKQQIQQPWDAADSYLIEHAKLGSQPAIINDHWGALTCFASQVAQSVYSWNDSFCSQRATENNLTNNSASNEVVLDNGLIQLAENCDSIWIQCPKSFDQLHWWLAQALQQLGAGIEVSLAGMAKHIPIKWLNWLEQYCDDYQQLPIKKKARLICFKLSNKLPNIEASKAYLGPDQEKLSALPGVFSRDHMDIGSRFFLEQLNKLPLSGKLVDLGCGNGLLSTACLYQYTNPLEPNQDRPPLELILCDDSALALHSAEGNLTARGYTQAQFYHTDALLSVTGPVDTILCNPPFHTGNRISTAAAERMFKQSANILAKNGQLLVVANRHLGYANSLKKRFRKVKLLASDTKFVVYRCQDGK